MNIPKINTTVFKNFSIYLLGAVCLGGFHIILAPINMRLLNPADYGVLALMTSSITIGAALMGMGLRQFLSIEYFHHDSLGQKKLINQIIILYALCAIPMCIILLILQPRIIAFLSLHHISPLLFILTLAATFLSFFAELFYQILKYQQRAWELIRIQISVATLALGTTIFLLVYADMGLLSNLIGQCITMGAATSIGFSAWRQDKFHHSFQLHAPQKTVLNIFKQSVPFIPGILCGWIIASSDRFVLASYATLHDVGIYAIADMAGQMFRLFILQSWGSSYLPYIMTQYHQNKDSLLAAEQKNLKTMWIAMGGIAIAFMGGYFISKPLLRFILPMQYHEAFNYIMIIIAGHIFLLGSYFAASFIQYHKKTYFLAASFCIPAVLNLILNLLLVHRFGIYGCTVATLISYMIYFGIMLGYNKRLQGKTLL